MNATTVSGLGRFKLLLRPELALVLLMATVIAMLIIPLPTFLVDLLIGLNMAVAIVIFLSSFYIERILGFSTFPSVLLFTTLMRLGLSGSTSRLILLDAPVTSWWATTWWWVRSSSPSSPWSSSSSSPRAPSASARWWRASRWTACPASR